MRVFNSGKTKLINQINSFEDLWVAFNTLQWDMMEKRKQAIVDHMENARHYVNGLTDGWYDFKRQIDQMEKVWGGQFQGDSKIRLDLIRAALERMLSLP